MKQEHIDRIKHGSIQDDLDDLVDRWHKGEGGSMPLHEWLGMTWEEYGPFAMDANHLPTNYILPTR